MPFTPKTIDFSSQPNFKIIFSRMPNLEYFSFSLVLPGISFGEVIQPTPTLDIKLPGDKLVYDPLTIGFLLQEDMTNYIELYNWIMGLAKPISTDQYKKLVTQNPSLTEKQNKYSDMSVFLLSNKNNPAVEITFKDVYPVSISALTFDSSVADYSPVTVDVTFNFLYFTIKKSN